MVPFAFVGSWLTCGSLGLLPLFEGDVIPIFTTLIEWWKLGLNTGLSYAGAAGGASLDVIVNTGRACYNAVVGH